ncbi:MAG TPA: YdeI/OmpD-associated family protein [Bryobacteraceae bacterium]|jgi:hypothetical protein|nr:YdeI/OmpD-associated family protein [Bryobacteraceae bacterium]
MAQKSYRFEAVIQAASSGGACVLFPYDVEQEFGTKARIPVQATFDGVPYRGSLMKYGHAQHMLGLLKSIREQIGKQPGDTVQVELRRDGEPRTLEIPPPFAKAMKAARVDKLFDSFSYTHRKDYVQWIAGAKKDETRNRRIEKAIEMIRTKAHPS